MLKTDSITHSYGEGSTAVTVLNNVSINIPEGGFTSIVGRSGSGKSTLLSVISSLLRPVEGDIYFKGTEITDLPDSKIDRLRKEEFSIIFQSHHLLPYLTAHENVLLPFLDKLKPVNARLLERGRICLERVGLQGKEKRLPGQLSGGEQQRVAIARALVKSPSILFADEPCGSLDKATGNEVMEILNDLNRDGLTIAMVTHDRGHASMAKETILLEDGRIVNKC
ncbi:ABC transporter ATP-binding protein [Desulfovibrio sp. JC010]|uniref:ABC transporter ATP-binding protein n=1 Tax=Desulfovibrio sp. JC010 TaxID=2593641 RepID=UPI0013D03205|nr:ABC transporter ATP-binding protein [Desulfovibrio sp. JC010]NDV25455.1 ABC transporter ATP-binding protein [Desulfovibrio sp. JC010]